MIANKTQLMGVAVSMKELYASGVLGFINFGSLRVQVVPETFLAWVTQCDKEAHAGDVVTKLTRGWFCSDFDVEYEGSKFKILSVHRNEEIDRKSQRPIGMTLGRLVTKLETLEYESREFHIIGLSPDSMQFSAEHFAAVLKSVHASSWSVSCTDGDTFHVTHELVAGVSLVSAMHIYEFELFCRTWADAQKGE